MKQNRLQEEEEEEEETWRMYVRNTYAHTGEGLIVILKQEQLSDLNARIHKRLRRQAASTNICSCGRGLIIVLLPIRSAHRAQIFEQA
jgi:hypothetical protein